MTAILFTLEEKQVLIASDTLVVDVETRLPNSYSTKIFPIPHLKGAMCMAGQSRIGMEWFSLLHTDILAQDMMFIDKIAPETLRQIASRQGAEGVSTSIYHFGWDEAEERFRGFAYRSERDWEGQELEYSFGMLPGRGLEEVTRSYETLLAKGWQKGAAEVIRELRASEELRPLFSEDRNERRVQIGGEIHQLVMQENRYLLSVCDRFEDFSEMFMDMLARCEAIQEAIAAEAVVSE